MYNKTMKNGNFLNNLKSNKSFAFNLILDKKIRIIYYSIPLLFLFISLILAIILLIISQSKTVTIVGITLCIISFVMTLIILIMNYFEKKFKYRVCEFFNLKNILEYELYETEMYNRDYLSIYHYQISNTKEVKWNTKTYNVDNLQLRFSYINYYDDEAKILFNGKKVTQIYLQKEIEPVEKRYIISSNKISDFNQKKINDCSLFISDENIKINNDVLKAINVLNNLNIDFNIYLEQNTMNIYFVQDNNFLFVNLEQKFDETKFNNDLSLINKIIEGIKN